MQISARHYLSGDMGEARAEALLGEHVYGPLAPHGTTCHPIIMGEARAEALLGEHVYRPFVPHGTTCHPIM